MTRAMAVDAVMAKLEYGVMRLLENDYCGSEAIAAVRRARAEVACVLRNKHTGPTGGVTRRCPGSPA